jgi:multiple sugar transport system substrate-binding protein
MINKLSRRRFLRLTAGAAAGTLIASQASGLAYAHPSNADSITLRIHHRLGVETDNWNFWAQKFNDKYGPNVMAKIEGFPGTEYFQKINTLAAGGTIGDAFWISSIEGFYRLAATGVISPIDDLVKDAGYDLKQHYDLCIKAASLNGKLYGLPQLAHPGRVGLFYNKPVFDAAKVTYPDDSWTYNDLLEAAKKLTNPDKGIFGFMDPESSYFSTLVWIRAWGGDVISADGIKCPINSPKAVEALNFLSDMYHKYKVIPPPNSTPNAQYQLFAANQLAMYQAGFWGVGVRDFVPQGTWGVAPMPKGPAGVRGSMFESDPIVLSSNSKHRKEAFDFMQMIASFDAEKRLKATFGATSSRPDVMADPDTLSDPTQKVFAGVMAEAMPLILPANFRETEYFKTIGEQLQAIWLGQATVDQVINDIQKAGQTILDKPSLASS